ncbi:hypothetical protein ACWGIA_34540 [Streptomyces bobili]
MPLVHVHGIGNRVSADPQQVAVRDALYRQHVLAAAGCDPAKSLILSPWWGGLVAEPAWGWATLNTTGVERLGGAEEVSVIEEAVDAVIAQVAEVEPDRVLVSAAAESLLRAIDIICAALTGTEEDLRLGAEFCGRATVFWAERTDNGRRGDGSDVFPWLTDVGDDAELLARLNAEMEAWHPASIPAGVTTSPEWETFGAPSGVPRAARAVLRRLNSCAATAVTRGSTAVLRGWPTRKIALLLGDVMGYFAQRDTAEAGAIVALVVEALEKASRHAAEHGEPLIVVAHSMGGNIVYDVLSHYCPDLRVDLLVTAGTQVGLFEELKLFRVSDRSLTCAGGGKVPALPNVGRWVNVVDPADPLAFAAAPVFDGAEDLRFDTGAWWAHGGYITSPYFHHRIGVCAAEGLR